MSRVLIAHATKHGSTAEIAETIADELDRRGVDVDCRRAEDVRRVDDYDAVVIGSAVYMRRWRRAARRLLARSQRALAERPLWIFSSGYLKERDPKWEEPGRVVALAERLGAREHVVFGGRVPPDPGNFMERAMLRDTPPEERDRRDFGEIRAWAARIAAELAPAPGGGPSDSSPRTEADG